jgi:hypothetical protein
MSHRAEAPTLPRERAQGSFQTQKENHYVVRGPAQALDQF